jgi:hypothetical protein
VGVKLTTEQRQQIVRTLTANSCNCSHDVPWKGKTPDQLNQNTDDDLYGWYRWHRTLNEAHAQGAGGGNVATGPANGGNRNPYPTINTPPVVVSAPAPQRPQGMAEWLALMPPEAQSIWASAVAVHNEEKGRLISQIVGNMAEGENRDKLINTLNSKELEELRLFAETLPRTQPTPVQPVANYFGAAAPVSVQPGTQEEPLTSPTYNFGRPGQA